MKKLLNILTFLLLTVSVSIAQKAVVSFDSETNSTKIDTVVNATTKNQVLKVSKAADILSIQVTATKISGTTAGVVRLYGSNDKVAWVRIKAGASLAAVDSLNLANVSPAQTIIFYDQPSRYLWYRAALTGSGTASTQLKTVAVAAK